MIRDQRAFLVITACVGVARLTIPALRGATVAWTLIGLLWLTGALWAGWRSRGAQERHLVGRLGVQNLAIQLLIVLPAVADSSWRLARGAPAEAGAAFLSNALVTAVALPLLSAVVLTFAAMLVAVPVSRIGGRG